MAMVRDAHGHTAISSADRRATVRTRVDQDASGIDRRSMQLTGRRLSSISVQAPARGQQWSTASNSKRPLPTQMKNSTVSWSSLLLSLSTLHHPNTTVYSFTTTIPSPTTKYSIARRHEVDTPGLSHTSGTTGSQKRAYDDSRAR
jgi:hypothetical protein